VLNRLFGRLRQKIQKRVLRHRSRRFPAEALNVNSCWEGIRQCIVFSLDGLGSELSALELVLRHLKSRFPDTSVTVVVGGRNTESLPPTLFDRALRIQKEHLDWLGLPVRRLRQRMAELEADLAIDLSPDFNPVSGALCQATGARLRVGFANPAADLAYNYQVAPFNARSGLDRYEVLVRYLG